MSKAWLGKAITMGTLELDRQMLPNAIKLLKQDKLKEIAKGKITQSKT